MEIRLAKSIPQHEQDELMQQFYEWRASSEKDNQDHIEQMMKNRDYEEGFQWDLSLKQRMEKDGKMCVTVPLIRPHVMQLVGHVISNPKDITAKPVKGGEKVLAELKSRVGKYLMDRAATQDSFVEMFHKGVSRSDGYIGFFIDDESDPESVNLIIRVLNEFDCSPDATCTTYDLNGHEGCGDGSKYFFWDEWVDADWVMKKWPEFEGKTITKSKRFTRKPYSRITRWLYGVVGKDELNRGNRRDDNYPNYEDTRYCLTHCWWIEWVEGAFITDNRTQEVLLLSNKKEIEQAKEAAKKHPEVFTLKDITLKTVHHSQYIGTDLVQDVVDELDVTRAGNGFIPVVRFSAIFSELHRAGVVDDMAGPQDVFNWMRSNIVNTLKLQPAAGYKIKQDINNYSQELQEMSGQSAVVLDESKAGGKIEQLKPPVISPSAHIISTESKGEIREVSNIRVPNPEKDDKDVSGRAIIAKQAETNTGVSPYTNNHDRSLRIFGNMLFTISTSERIVSDREIYMIIEEESLVDPSYLDESRAVVIAATGFPPPQEPRVPRSEEYPDASPEEVQIVAQNYVAEKQVYEQYLQAIDKIAIPMAIRNLIAAFRNPLSNKYSAAVSLSPYSVTHRLTAAANVIDGAKLMHELGYPPLPEQFILENLDIPNIEKVLQERGYA